MMLSGGLSIVTRQYAGELCVTRSCTVFTVAFTEPPSTGACAGMRDALRCCVRAWPAIGPWYRHDSFVWARLGEQARSPDDGKRRRAARTRKWATNRGER